MIEQPASAPDSQSLFGYLLRLWLQLAAILRQTAASLAQGCPDLPGALFALRTLDRATRAARNLQKAEMTEYLLLHPFSDHSSPSRATLAPPGNANLPIGAPAPRAAQPLSAVHPPAPPAQKLGTASLAPSPLASSPDAPRASVAVPNSGECQTSTSELAPSLQCKTADPERKAQRSRQLARRLARTILARCTRSRHDLERFLARHALPPEPIQPQLSQLAATLAETESDLSAADSATSNPASTPVSPHVAQPPSAVLSSAAAAALSSPSDLSQLSDPSAVSTPSHAFQKSHRSHKAHKSYRSHKTHKTHKTYPPSPSLPLAEGSKLITDNCSLITDTSPRIPYSFFRQFLHLDGRPLPPDIHERYLAHLAASALAPT